MTRITFSLFISLLIAHVGIQNVLAETVYKSTDESGMITYSQEAPKAASSTESVKIAPGPSPETIRAAQQEAREAIQRADDLMKQRQAYNQKMFEEREKTRREAQKRASEQQQYQIEYRNRYPYSYYPRPRPPYWGGRPPHYRPPVAVPYQPPGGRLMISR